MVRDKTHVSAAVLATLLGVACIQPGYAQKQDITFDIDEGQGFFPEDIVPKDATKFKPSLGDVIFLEKGSNQNAKNWSDVLDFRTEEVGGKTVWTVRLRSDSDNGEPIQFGILQPNPLFLPEMENSRLTFAYTPTQDQPGFSTGFNMTYKITSPKEPVPEQSSFVSLGIPMSLLGAAIFFRRRRTV